MVDVTSDKDVAGSDEVFKEVCGLVTRFAPEGMALTPDTELAAQLNIDSVAAMDLVMEIEDHYNIDIPINEIADLRTLGDLAKLVRRHVKG
ncbi:acyl carrier protein [Arboricoccus pini]|uniref:Acyl carrier protein n=1 Tax=Arboricoccus pini TaxID=1963835 RepID=A0A212QQC4_9PROT|nr:acyl carrier protein [Arboricoccus pini]SNB61698.1 acyl carrier protein [Arboricoccus pini]